MRDDNKFIRPKSIANRYRPCPFKRDASYFRKACWSSASGAWALAESCPTPTRHKQREDPMAEFRNYQTRAVPGSRVDASIDEGLRAYMIKVYNLMALGLAITGVAALIDRCIDAA